MPKITDWLMVGITFVYVIATVFICKFNYKSAKASKDQLEEMKEQYQKNDRPIIEAEFLYIDRTFFGIRFVNHGKHTAQNVHIELSDDFISSIDELGVSEIIRLQKDKRCVIGVDQHYDLLFGSYDRYKNLEEKPPAKGTIVYEYNNNEYTNEFFFDFENYMTIFSVGGKNEDLLQQLASVAGQLESMNLNYQTSPRRR